MPFIKTMVSCEIDKAQEEEIKSRMGKAIELVFGKSEEYLLLEFESDCHLWLRGNNTEPIAYIEAAIFGNEPHYGYDKFTTKVTEIISDVLGIASDHIYIKYEDIIGWGVNGMYIDRNIY